MRSFLAARILIHPVSKVQLRVCRPCMREPTSFDAIVPGDVPTCTSGRRDRSMLAKSIYTCTCPEATRRLSRDLALLRISLFAINYKSTSDTLTGVGASSL